MIANCAIGVGVSRYAKVLEKKKSQNVIAMVRATFDVELTNLSVAPRGASSNSNGTSFRPYLVINFADDYKKFTTDAKNERDTFNWPSYSEMFQYVTNYAHRLDIKRVQIECFSKNNLFADELIGTASIDLHTVVTGSSLNKLSLKDASGAWAGTVEFQLSMSQQCDNVQARLLNVTASTDLQGSPNSIYSLQYSCSLSLNKPVTSEVVPPLSQSPLVAQFAPTSELAFPAPSIDAFEKGSILLRVRAHANIGVTDVALVTIPLGKYYTVGQVPVAFSEPIMAGNVPHGTLTGQLLVLEGPSFSQLIGGVNEDNGVQPGTLRFANMPLPSRLLGQVRARQEAPRVSISAPAAPMPAKIAVHAAAAPAASGNLPAVIASAPAASGNLPAVIASAPAASAPVAAASASNLPAVLNQGASASNLFVPASVVQATPSPRGGVALAPVAMSIGHSPMAAVPQIQQPAVMLAQPTQMPTLPMNVDVIPRKDLLVPVEIQPFPRDWSHAVDAQGNIYFKYSPTRQTSWQDPRFVPEGWDQRVDQQGKLYFAHAPTRTTSWTDPRGLPAGWHQIMVAGNPSPLYTEQSSGLSTPLDPRGLPAGVTQHITPASGGVTAGRIFFKNHQTRSTQWEDPRLTLHPQVLKQLRTEERQKWEANLAKQLIPVDPIAEQIKALDADLASQIAKLSMESGLPSRGSSEIARWEKEYRANIEAEKKARQAILNEKLAASKRDFAARRAESKRLFDEQKRALETAHAAEKAERDALDSSARTALQRETEALLASVQHQPLPGVAGAPGAVAMAPVAAAAQPAVFAQPGDQHLPPVINHAPAQVDLHLPPVIGQH